MGRLVFKAKHFFKNVAVLFVPPKKVLQSYLFPPKKMLQSYSARSKKILQFYLFRSSRNVAVLSVPLKHKCCSSYCSSTIQPILHSVSLSKEVQLRILQFGDDFGHNRPLMTILLWSKKIMVISEVIKQPVSTICCMGIENQISFVPCGLPKPTFGRG